MVQLLSPEELPPPFRYPAELLWIVDLGLVDLNPWIVLDGESLRGLNEVLRKRFSPRILIPFGRRCDCDDIACWEVGKPGKVIVVDISLPEGFEASEDLKSFWQEYPDFWAWFRQAVEDMIEFAVVELQ
jgi:hypothetical protein